MAGSDRVQLFAEALFTIAQTSPQPAEVEDELFRLARIFEGSDELRSSLTDTTIPAPRRQQIVEELLAGRATAVTTALVSLVVASDRAADLPRIVDAMAQRSAAAGNRSLAEVRSAVPLSDDQQTRLAAALERQLGYPVQVRVVIDPSVVGGIITQIGDTVIDGSIRTRLAQLREAF
jgi:F-type H+-transporting ATPase subunit delta